MDEIIIRFLQGRAEPKEARELAAWRAASPENERHFTALSDIWAMTGAASAAASGTLASSPDPEVLVALADSGEGPPRSRWAHPIRTAALAAGFAAVGFGLATLFTARQPQAGLLAESEITTGVGEMTTVTLGDGTSIRVGPRTRLRLEGQGRDRSAWLDGRAFFAVQADSSRTFTVRTRHGEAVVFGTRFEVRSEAEEFRVLVVDGVVQVKAGGSAEDLREGEMSRSAPGAPPSKTTVENVDALLDWMGNALVFQRTPMARVIHEIESRYRVDVVLEDPDLSELDVTATFTGQSLDEVVLVLCEIIAARCTVDEDQVRIGAVSR